MKFLLVIFAFTMGPDGNVQEARPITYQFFTLEECNAAGRNLRELTKTDGPEYSHIKTLSYCVTDADYKAKVT